MPDDHPFKATIRANWNTWSDILPWKVWVRTAEFRAFLDEVRQNVPQDLEVHLILDNYITHKSKVIQYWLLGHPRFQLHFTPTSGSWLNLVE